MNTSTTRKTILAIMVTAVFTVAGSVSAHSTHSGGLQAKATGTL